MSPITRDAKTPAQPDRVARLKAQERLKTHAVPDAKGAVGC